ncbi:hypothetical protein PsorP6_013489 [Peronosclerospora sorghi]|uniref:Uncharacterized protein n=1 Tax=Peronosclerospora sorghi TaxID=230839 RepID=A0ACC0VIU5_9STRA|nr:hypothetical protein PsorP6_013489 [Peronosclerospora sorghi]
MLPTSSTTKQSLEADRSRLCRMKATPEARKSEAERRKRRREQLTPSQRQVDAERLARVVPKQRQTIEEHARSSVPANVVRMRRSNSAIARRNQVACDGATAPSRGATKSHATKDQRLRERERCLRRYEIQKQQKLLAKQTRTPSEDETQASLSAPSVSNATTASPSRNDHKTFPRRSRVLPRDLEQRNQLLLQQQAGLGLQTVRFTPR